MRHTFCGDIVELVIAGFEKSPHPMKVELDLVLGYSPQFRKKRLNISEYIR